jgi:DNA-binding NtrC family response regulator
MMQLAPRNSGIEENRERNYRLAAINDLRPGGSAVASRLFISTGPNAGESIVLDADPVVVGRAKGCTFRLDDPFVSREHFKIERRGASYWVLDLGGRNPIAVNGLPTALTELAVGDEIRVGSTRLLFMDAGENERPVGELARQLTSILPRPGGRFEMVGSNAAMLRIFETIQKIAPLDVTALIVGESGTGKELVAKAIHQHSKRAKGPLVSVNCAVLARDLMESELFGHEKGAFTGAHAQRLGKFELAGGGTLFLDEIGELSAEAQAKLLRVLEERVITRVGGEKEFRVDTRIVAATNRDLRAMVEAGSFRQDLLFRLEVVRLKVPPLRERREDIPKLARYFLARFREDIGRHIEDIAADALELLTKHDWPGNVRELRNVMERAVIFASGSKIVAGEIDLHNSVNMPSPIPQTLDGSILPLDRVIQKELSRALGVTGGNKKKAAELLGIPRSTLYDL